MTRSLLPFALATIVAGLGSIVTNSFATAEDELRFSRDILPILSDNCFLCHGPDQNTRKADLRLDTPEGTLRTESPVVVPRKSDDSELYLRLISDDPGEVMPPPKSGRKLSPQQVELIKRWIDQGAPWGKHWAFETPRRPAVPESRDAALMRHPIDAFVRARLEREGLSPAPEASRETLIRRVTLDLTGLPPTPAEVDAFVADSAPDAFEKVVDRLLSSPRFGERMVWEWLDAARYADTNGYQGDPTRTMYFWRDWVIQALNDNMPFDQFSVEQLAGDLLPSPTQSQLIATGFHRNHMINGEGGRIAEESRVDYVQDRVETTGTVWMGLTLNCCRCHDHKFDPLAQREYYQLAAYFNSIDESGANDAGGLANPIISLATLEQQKRLEELRGVETALNRERDTIEKKLREQQPEWEKSLAASGALSEPTWIPLAPDALKAEQGTELVKLEDGSVLAKGPNPDKDNYTVTAKVKLGTITGIKLEALPDERFVNKGPGRADNGNFVLSEFQLSIDDRPLELAALKADFEQSGLPLVNAVDGKLDTGWAVLPEFGRPHTALFQIRSPLASEAEATLSCKLSCQFGRQHTLGRFRLSVTTAASSQLRPLPDEIRALLQKPAEQRNDGEKQKLAAYHRDQDAEYVAAKKRSDDARGERERFERALPRTMVMRERAQPRDTTVLVRGAYDKPGEKVTHGVPAILPPLPPEAPPNRLALARWLVSPVHPLTARVTVNRLWQTFFGTGLVKTAEDFGVQGERPSHPELLDWLACELVEPTLSQPSVAQAGPKNAWNMKHLIRLIVTSGTYRQSSKIPPGMAERDPENRLLARGPRLRLPSWMIRDQALAASGLLVEKLGGPPVKGYQPPGIWEEATFGNIRYQADQGEALYRRSVYQFWRRIVGPTMFFDVANRQTCQVKVARTNTPLQALITLNDVTYVEAARALAERVLTEAATPEQRVELIYRKILARRPSSNEQQVLLDTLRKFQEQFARDPEGAKKLLKVGESKRNEALDPIQHAACTALCGLVLNLDETLNKE